MDDMSRTARKLGSLLQSQDSKRLKNELLQLALSKNRSPDLLPLIGSLISHKRHDIATLSLSILKDYKTAARRYIPKMRTMAKTKFAALEALCEITKNWRTLVPYLKYFIKRFPEEVADLICRAGIQCKELVPDLIQVIRRGDWDEIWAAVDALAVIGKHASSARPILGRLLRHESTLIADRAAQALMRIATDSQRGRKGGKTKEGKTKGTFTIPQKGSQ